MGRLCCRGGQAGPSSSSFNKMLLTMTIVTYLLLPEVILNLLAPLGCFKSIASERIETDIQTDPIDLAVTRMSILPVEYCDGAYYQSLMTLIAPGFLIYAIVLPLLALWRAAKKSHVIYKTGSNRDNPSLEENEAGSILEEQSVLFKFGFLFSGLVIARRDIKFMPKFMMANNVKAQWTKPSTGSQE